MLPSFGKAPSGQEKEKTESSPQYRDGQFQNIQPTTMLGKDTSYAKLFLSFINKPKSCYPPKPLQAIETNIRALPLDKPQLVWFGHSSYYIILDGKKILVDPVFSGYVSPVKGMNKAFAGTNIYSADDFPEIDVLLITHDHYDHLDYETILKLKKKVKLVCTSLGVASHLLYWGFDKERVKELDWHSSVQIDDDMKLTALPARHFSGRLLKRNQTLWSSFILETKTTRLYLGGDSGYGDHFKEIGEKYGPFALALLECGQYNTAWHDIHMLPEETAQAAADLKADAFMPVHWAKFCISLHPWNDPIIRVTKKASELNINIITPMIGEPFIIGEEKPQTKWWKEV